MSVLGQNESILSVFRAVANKLAVTQLVAVALFAVICRPAICFGQDALPPPDVDEASYIPVSFSEHFAEHSEDGHSDHYQTDSSHETHSGHHDSHGGAHHGHLEIAPMIGGFSRGAGQNNLMFPIDRVLGIQTGLTVPALGPGASPVTVTGASPVDIIRPGSIRTSQDLQQLYRQHLMLPSQNVVGSIPAAATFTSTQSLDQINAAFAATLQPYDLISIQPPPGSYVTSVDAVFDSANQVAGQTIFDPTTSAAIRSSTTESVAPLNQPLAAADMVDVFYAFDYVASLPIPSPSADSLIGRSTVGANASPIPTDRLYFDYSLVKNGVPFSRSENFDRYTIGIEKIIGHGEFSLELRLPFAASLDHQLVIENGQGASQTEMGNALVIAKHEIASNEQMVVSGGLALSVPTGSDVEVNNAAGTPLIKLVNEATHLKPFLAVAIAPDDHWFLSSFLEYDFPAGRGNALVNLDGGGLESVGRFRDASHVLWDISVGHWSEEAHDSLVRRWAPVVELHFDKGFSDGSEVRGNSYRLFDISEDRSVVNLLAGVTMDLHSGRYFSFGFLTGVGGDGSESDGEFRATLNWPFDFK